MARFVDAIHSVGSTLEKWTKPATIVAGVVSLLWALLLLPVAKRSQSLVTWIRSDSMVYPSDASSNRPLPLDYRGIPVRSARIVSVRLQNRGSAPIGSADALWTLTFTAPTASHLMQFGALRIDPMPLAVAPTRTQKPNTYALSFGLLDPRVAVDLQLLLLNSRSDQAPLAVRSTLVGLPSQVTLRAPDDQLATRYFWPWAAPILLLLSVPVLPPLAREWYQRRPAWKRALYLPGYLLIAIGCLFVPAFLWVWGLSHVVSWFY